MAKSSYSRDRARASIPRRSWPTSAIRAAGGTALFVGTTRNENEGRVVERLEYEAYEAMAVDEMRRIGDEIARPLAA